MGAFVERNGDTRGPNGSGAASGSVQCAASAGSQKGLNPAEIGPTVRTRNLDSGPSLPISANCSRGKAAKRWWWLLGIGLAMAIALAIWLRI
jgi:hypothetical protein